MIRSQNQWYHELGPGRANLFSRHSGAHNPKVLEVSIIAILLQSLQNYDFSPGKANSFNARLSTAVTRSLKLSPWQYESRMATSVQ